MITNQSTTGIGLQLCTAVHCGTNRNKLQDVVTTPLAIPFTRHSLYSITSSTSSSLLHHLRIYSQVVTCIPFIADKGLCDQNV